jgi:probable HAF family extracellular repeat protein
MAITSVPDFRGDSTFSAFITGPNGTGVRGLGTLGGESAIAYGINNAGQVVGRSDTAEGVQHGFITGANGEGMSDLGTLGGDFSAAFAIDAAGQVAGASTTAENDTHAFITGPDGYGMRDLGTLGGDSAMAYDINNAGEVVGSSGTPSGISHAFITGPGEAGLTDLNLLVDLPRGVILTEARGINNSGQVVAAGDILIPPIPEPETYALLLAGLALIGGAVVRGKKDTRLLLVPS